MRRRRTPRRTAAPRPRRAAAAALLLIALAPSCESYGISPARGVAPPPSSCRSSRRRPSDHSGAVLGRLRGLVLFVSSSSSGDDSDSSAGNRESDDIDPAQFSEQSQMLGFISDYLRKERNDLDEFEEFEQGANLASSEPSIRGPQAASDNTSRTGVGSEDDYLIAVPLDSCHELGLELESVQRAILYHCPVLVHACIPMASTRLPLLYVTPPWGGPAEPASSSSSSAALQSVVQRAVRRVMFDATHPADDEEEAHDEDRDGVRRDDGRPDVGGANADGVRPILVPFSTLEIDGVNNAVLCTVGDSASPGGRALARLVRELRTDIESNLPGWTVRLPDDPASAAAASVTTASGEAPGGAKKFRLRVPFVRLPPNWDDYLDPSKDYHTSDEGGNGISPILWGQWMDDDFGDAVRMREVAIYPRRRRPARSGQRPSAGGGGGADDDDDNLQTARALTEEAIFHVPDFVVALPEGNAELAKVEKKFATYQSQRIQEAEARERQLAQEDAPLVGKRETVVKANSELNGLKNDPPISNTPLDKYDALFTRTLDRLGSLYADDASEADDESEPAEESTDSASLSPATWTDEAVTAASANESLVVAADATPELRHVVVAPEASEESRERMRRVVESRARIETERDLLAKRKQDKPPFEENPVFAKYKDGTLVPSSTTFRMAVGESSPPRVLPPFPSNEHMVGFWRVVRSPTGFDVEEGDSSRSDNLVLRVDGTTAGGPILNKDTRQKASAGTWRLLVSNDADSRTDDADSGPRTANLRIRLVIPPQKERILVMQGKLERVSMSGSDLPLAPRGTFGIPALEERASRGSGLEQDMEDLVYCSGTVFMEDAVTGLNRDEIGTFTLQKLFTPTDPAQYTITIPRPVRTQD